MKKAIDMWWTPIAFAMIIIGVIVGIAGLMQKQKNDRYFEYRKKYLNTIKRLEALTLDLSMMYPKISSKKVRVFLDQYENLTKELEELLKEMMYVPPHAGDLNALKKAQLAIRQLTQKCMKLKHSSDKYDQLKPLR